jgi:hypothetical protein
MDIFNFCMEEEFRRYGYLVTDASKGVMNAFIEAIMCDPTRLARAYDLVRPRRGPA